MNNIRYVVVSKCVGRIGWACNVVEWWGQTCGQKVGMGQWWGQVGMVVCSGKGMWAVRNANSGSGNNVQPGRGRQAREGETTGMGGSGKVTAAAECNGRNVYQVVIQINAGKVE